MQTSTYSGTATIISQQNIVSLVPSPIGPKQSVAILSLFQKEMKPLRNAFTNCNYPKWALDKVEKRCTRSTVEVNDGANSQGTSGTQPTTNEVKTKGHIVIPYTQGLCKSIKKICGRCDIQTLFKGSNTIRNLLVSPNDKDPMVNKSRAICWFQ